MEVMVIGHTYAAPINRQKIKEIAKQVNLLLLAPKKYVNPQLDLTVTEGKREQAEYGIVLDECFLNPPGKPHFIVYKKMGECLKRFKPDIIQIEAEPFFLSFLQAGLLKPRKAKLVFFTWQNVYRKSILHYLVKPIEKFNFGRSDFAIAGSNEAKEVLERKGFKKGIVVLPQLGVNAQQFRRIGTGRLRAKLGLNGFVVGFVGRFVAEKGILLLLKALAGINCNWTLLLVGNGPLKPEIVALGKKLNIGKKIVFQSTVEHEKIPLYLNCMDCLVLPSISTPEWREQFGHVLIEAMACSVPVIGSSSGAIPEVIGNSGIVFGEGNVEQLRQKLIQLMKNKGFRENLAKKGRKRVLENFTNKAIAKKTVGVYEKILNA